MSGSAIPVAGPVTGLSIRLCAMSVTSVLSRVAIESNVLRVLKVPRVVAAVVVSGGSVDNEGQLNGAARFSVENSSVSLDLIKTFQKHFSKNNIKLTANDMISIQHTNDIELKLLMLQHNLYNSLPHMFSNQHKQCFE